MSVFFVTLAAKMLIYISKLRFLRLHKSRKRTFWFRHATFKDRPYLNSGFENSRLPFHDNLHVNWIYLPGIKNQGLLKAMAANIKKTFISTLIFMRLGISVPKNNGHKSIKIITRRKVWFGIFLYF